MPLPLRISPSDFSSEEKYIEVDEKGTKAAAATVVVMGNGSAQMVEEYKTVYLDRPFVYMLIDCRSNVPFFIGTMMEP